MFLGQNPPWPCVSFHLLQPGWQIEEAFHICHIVHHKDPLCPPIEICYQRPEPFVPGRVPQLKFYLSTVQLQCPDLKVNPNCWDETMAEDVFGVSVGNSFKILERIQKYL